MAVNPRLLLVCSALLAATGQIFFKLGTAGTATLADYINAKLALGLALYGASTILWIYALTSVPLSKAYPFTVLTFVLVYVGSAIVLGEKLSFGIIAGALLVLAGLIVLTLS